MIGKLCIAVAAVSLATPALAQDAATPNSAPREGWQYGHGNNYSPSNTLVDATAVGLGDELALRIHQTGEVAPASTGNVYSFALGLPADQYSFDWDLGLFNHGADSALITLTNIGTGQTFSYNPLAPGNDNTAAFDALTGSYSSQNSFRFNWAPIGFDPSANGSYSVNLSTSLGGNTQYSLTATAQFGSGTVAAVPEPATWAMMLFGFGGIGFATRRKRAPALAQIA
ncbi:hypothetical protein SCH01S_51_00100 [Sphingomonas changbaiensis NBRC 104936]|uniref:Ice-binding protein C-terminal domain-containing protein n=1 Tax=Sphingomonas changbaiensis NBRC 104936 TaxID=1219043 RepID=A0A0E9MU62_9SPHN|nr:PEPxxWA-CTERM sorting domain-containing protein [Sphingomonas changbaiensis]GAO40680.1 hypothetical protein SCH01S_51_00100 [Sphingomonas changbaiensis NBRC 104936]